jgi:hypothetical protein
MCVASGECKTSTGSNPNDSTPSKIREQKRDINASEGVHVAEVASDSTEREGGPTRSPPPPGGGCRPVTEAATASFGSCS